MEPVDYLPNWLAQLLFWIYYNQTLIAGLLALAVGGVTVHHLRKQIALEHDRHQNERHRKLLALKAGLPIALSQIHKYADAQFAFLERFFTSDGSFAFVDGDWLLKYALEEAQPEEIPEYPADSFRTLQFAIEQAEPADAFILHEIIAYGQINESRFRSVAEALNLGSKSSLVLTETNMHYTVRDVLGMKMHAVRAFQFGRNNTDHIEQLADAKEASTKLSPSLNTQKICKFISEHWPPNFPNR